MDLGLAMERFARNPSPNVPHCFSRKHLGTWFALILTLGGLLLAWFVPGLPAARGFKYRVRPAHQVQILRRSRGLFRPGLRVAGLVGLRFERRSLNAEDQPANVEDLERDDELSALGQVAPLRLDVPAAAPAGASPALDPLPGLPACPMRC
jgi:hypothetical protein